MRRVTALTECVDSSCSSRSACARWTPAAVDSETEEPGLVAAVQTVASSPPLVAAGAGDGDIDGLDLDIALGTYLDNVEC
jgi:hypothetical protein